MEENYLIHYGVKGMKWGVIRNKPTAAGTSSKKKKKISPAEEAKSMSNEELRAKNRRMQLEKRYSELTKPDSKSSYDGLSQAAKAGSSANATASKIHKTSIGDKAYDKSIAKSAYGAVGGTLNTVAGTAELAGKVSRVSKNTKHGKTVNKQLSEMSDDDLARKVERLDLERTYTSLKSESSKRGKASVGEIMSIAGSAVVVASSAITAAVTIASLISKSKKKYDNSWKGIKLN